jgi:hypothetical protein
MVIVYVALLFCLFVREIERERKLIEEIVNKIFIDFRQVKYQATHF